jgi:hypothetical protein
MLIPAPPKSNLQRQREFQKAHPGYDRLRKARARAGHKQIKARLAAEHAALLAAAVAEAQPLALPTPATENDGQLLLFPALRPAA